MATTSGYRRAPQLAYRRLGDETVVLDPRGRSIIGLNDAGGAVLDALAEPRSVATLLGSGPNAEVRLLATGLAEFLEQLVAIGLAERSDAIEAPEVIASPEPGWVEAPAVLWREPMVEAVQQTSPPQAITNPQCHP